VFIDGLARLRMFTPMAARVFPLRPVDIGRDLRDFMPRGTDDHLIGDIEVALKAPQVLDREMTLGDGRIVRRRLAPYRDVSERDDGVVLTYVDITSQVRLRERMLQAAAQAQIQAIVESVPHLMWTCTPDGSCDYLSPQWAAYTGIPADQQLGASWVEQVHPADRPGLMAAWSQSVERHQDYSVRFRLRRRDGSYRWFDTRAVPQRDPETGQVVRWYGSSTDVHDAITAQKALRDNEEFLRLMTDNVSGLVGYWDRNFRNRYANRHYREWFGKQPTEIVGRTALELYGPTLWEQNRPRFEAAMRGEPQLFERSIVLPDGTERHALANYLPHVVDDEVVGMFVTVTDVSPLHEARHMVDRDRKSVV
jgi:PAS domain S-box-containing protein